MTSESWRSCGDSARWGRDSARWSYSSAQGQRFVCRAGEHSWMLRAEVSFSDGNEIKNGTKGKRDKESGGGERISLSLAFNDFTEAFRTYSLLIYGFCNVILLLLSLEQGIQMAFFTGWPFIKCVSPLGLVKSRMKSLMSSDSWNGARQWQTPRRLSVFGFFALL